MTKRTDNYRTGVPRSEQFYCPSCGEFLQPADIESFAECPYCGAKLPRDRQFEEYILLPVVSRWIERSTRRYSTK
ncbi:MAG: hypothetical protein PHI35_03050 [Victivallaceae bacterium]|nr:hypothetical protein [Victivallaceae bacterium]